MIRSPKHRTGPLLSLSAGLAGVLALEVMAGPFFVPEAPSISPGTRNSVIFPRGSPAEKPAISTFAEVVKRPLFTPSRRPPPAKTDSNIAGSVPKPETFDLIGVIISADRRMALLRTVATSEVMRAVEGQSVGGWEVRAIKPTQVILRRGNDSEVIKISDAAKLPADDPSVAKNPWVSGEAGSPSSLSKKSPPPETPGEGAAE